MQIFKKIKEKFWGWSGYFANKLSQDVLDTENEGWVQLDREARNWRQTYISEISLDEIREMSRYLDFLGCHYGGLIKTYVKYIAGKKILIEDKDNDEARQVKWDGWKKKIKWNKFSKELVRRFFRDGEIFIYIPTWKFIDPYCIRSEASNDNTSFGIEKDQYTQEVIAYSYLQPDNSFLIIPANDIIHVAYKDSDEKRGIPYFFATMAKIRDFDKWLKDRMLLNRIRASIAVIRKHNTSASEVKTFADARVTSSVSPKETNYGESIRKQIFEPGTIIDTNMNTEYQFLEPKINAEDVKADGRSIMLAVCAATGLPEYMVTGDASNANYSSTLVSESPAVREFQHWQSFFEDVFQEIWDCVQNQEIGLKVDSDCVVTFPDLISRDTEKEAKTNEILLANSVISLQEWRRREGVDNDKMEKEINGSLNEL